ncbi:MAG: Fe-S-containing protein [Acidobacteriota bacterium]
MKITPLRAIFLIAAFAAILLTADWVDGSLTGRQQHIRVAPDREGLVRIDVSDLEQQQVRFYRFLNTGNQEILFFVGRDNTGTIQAAFNAGDSHYKVKRGFSHDNGWIIDNKCERASPLADVNKGGSGCQPEPLDHTVQGTEVVFTESDILRGWRYFR